MKLFWVEFRDESVSTFLCGAYVSASSSLAINLFWPMGDIVSKELIVPRYPIADYNPIRLDNIRSVASRRKGFEVSE